MDTAGNIPDPLAPGTAPATPPKVIATVACDLEFAPLGTRSRLLDSLGGRPVLQRTLAALRAVPALGTIVLLAPAAQHAALRSVIMEVPDVEILPLNTRHAFVERRVRAGRAWNLCGWRGGAGQWTVFDEDYHPAAVGEACRHCAADHVLSVPAHGALLDPALLAALLHHHLYQNHEMRVTYTPAAPGLCGLALRADIVAEMAASGCMPGNLLGYEPAAPTVDTLIREACMQVDPALSKIPNRFLVDTQRSWQMVETLLARGPWDCPAALAAAARDLPLAQRLPQPREIQLELTPRRCTHPPGSVPAAVAAAVVPLDARPWQQWLGRHTFADDLLLTVGGDGDPLLYPDLLAVLRAARASGARHIHLQTDLLDGTAMLLQAMAEDLVDVLSVCFYGDDAPTYAAVGGYDGHAAVCANLEQVIKHSRQTLVVPRLLKVRQTIGQLEAFFDRWVSRTGWAVLDGPTDRAGAVPFGAVVDMAPPKRRACRRLAERLVLRADGRAVACDQDIHALLNLGPIADTTLEQMWLGAPLMQLRSAHAAGAWGTIDPCRHCREWHRP